MRKIVKEKIKTYKLKDNETRPKYHKKLNKYQIIKTKEQDIEEKWEEFK